MRITVEIGRPARRSTAILLGLVLLAVPGVALANHMFNDVPADHPFHTPISAIAKAGITAGFPDGGYHPSDNVTRQAMAAFLERGLGHIAHNGQTALNTDLSVPENMDFTPDVAAKEVAITVPGATNPYTPLQLVYVHGRIELIGSMSTSAANAGCPCEFVASILDATDAVYSPSAAATFESSTATIGTHTWTIDAVFLVPPGVRVFKLMVQLGDRVNPITPASWNISQLSTLTAMTFPFGDTDFDPPG